MNEEYGLLEFYNFLISKLIFMILFSMLGVGAAFYYTEDLEKWYEYEILIRSGSIEKPANTGPESIFMSPKKSSYTGSSLKIESAAYVEFKYKNLNKVEENLEAFLKEIHDIGNTELFRIVIRGKSLAVAQKYAENIFEDVKQKHEPIIEKHREQKQTQLKFANDTLNDLKTGLNEVQSAIEKIGFNPALMEKKINIEQQIKNSEKEILDLNLFLSLNNIKDFEILSSRPISKNAVEPKINLILALTGLISFLLSFSILFIFDQINFAKKLKSLQEEKKEFEKPLSKIETKAG